MQVSPAPHYGLLDSDNRLAVARGIIRIGRSMVYEMKFGLIGFAIGTSVIAGASFASAPKQPVVVASVTKTAPADLLWPELTEVRTGLR